MSVYVGDLSSKVTENKIFQAFAEATSVKLVLFPPQRQTSHLRQCSVEMPRNAEKAAAMNALGTGWIKGVP